MNSKVLSLLILFSVFTFTSCDEKNHHEKIDTKNNIISLQKKFKPIFQLKESINLKDYPQNEYLNEELKPIRENFKKLNSVKLADWSKIQTKELLETNEGGKVTYYYWDSDLSKIITKQYGETFQVLTEYYFLNKKISFVFEKLYTYNRPVYHAKTAMNEMNDSEAFDIHKSEITETRSYFNNGKLIHQITSDDCGSPFSETYLKEEQSKIEQKVNILLNNEN